MKQIFIKIFMSLIVIFSLSSCQNDDPITVANSGTAPSFSFTPASSYKIDSLAMNQTFEVFKFKPADYGADVVVKYVLQMDSTAEFKNPKDVGDNGTLGYKYIRVSNKTINDVLIAWGVQIGKSKKVYFRLVATPPYSDETEAGKFNTQYLSKLYSNPISTTIFPAIPAGPPPTPPAKKFYIVGAAAPWVDWPGGWSAGKAQLLYGKDQVHTLFAFLKSGNFRFLGQQDWKPTNYSIDNAGTTGSEKYFKIFPPSISLGDFENMKFSGASGGYKIVIKEADQSLEITALNPTYNPADISALHIFGAGIGGVDSWNANTAPAMTSVGQGVFTYTATLSATSEFKFLLEQGNSNLNYGNISGKGDTGYIAPNGMGNDNIVFKGDGSTYLISVNIYAGTYTIIKQ